MLGFIYEDGDGVKQDHAEALKWFRRAADSGHTEAMVHIGRHYRFGEGVTKDLSEAGKWFRTAAAKGEPAGTLNLGWLYGYEQDDQDAALKCFREAASQGLTEAMYELYLSYWNGKGLTKDRAEAKKWLTQAAEAGLAKAQYRLGYLNDLDTTTWRQNPVEAVRWYRRAADQNWPGAQLKLAEYYLDGKVVEQDEERALELMRAATDQDYAPAVRKLAELYARGIGEPRGRGEEPMQLLKRVTQLQPSGERSSSQWAYQEIVRRYQYGWGTEKDLITAAQWYCRGAEAGVWFFSTDGKTEERPRLPSGEPMTSTPDLRGVISLILPEQESDEFLRVLRAYLRVATAHDTQIAIQFGERYLAGRDAPRDAVKAWCWFKVAGESGAASVSGRVSECDARMSNEQRADAARESAELNRDLRNLATTGGSIPRPSEAATNEP
jgi:TPR repeat protein